MIGHMMRTQEAEEQEGTCMTDILVDAEGHEVGKAG